MIKHYILLLKKKSKKINHLKPALYIDEETEFVDEIIYNTIYEQNLKNILLLKLIIKTILKIKGVDNNGNMVAIPYKKNLFLFNTNLSKYMQKNAACSAYL